MNNTNNKHPAKADLTGRTILVTGASRGLGAALVNQALAQNAEKVYATARSASDISILNPRLETISLELADRGSIVECHKATENVDLLINNAGINFFETALQTDDRSITSEFQVNFFGTLTMMQYFASTMNRDKGANIANVLSICALAPMPSLAGYSASKAALNSITQSMRVSLRTQNITVHSIYPGPLVTQMNAGLTIPNITPCDVAAETIMAGILDGSEKIFPDPTSINLNSDWLINPELVEKKFSQY